MKRQADWGGTEEIQHGTDSMNAELSPGRCTPTSPRGQLGARPFCRHRLQVPDNRYHDRPQADGRPHRAPDCL